MFLSSWKLATAGAVLALTPLVAAQTPAGFVPEISSHLTVTYAGNILIATPGERLQRSELAMPPTFGLPMDTPSGQALLMMLDLDVPQNNSRTTLLHWMATNITVAQASNGSTSITLPADGGIAPYKQPGPPPGDIPHRYTFIMFSQPAMFAVPAAFTSVLQTRVGFDYMGFIKDTGLTQALGANYMTVQNTSMAVTGSMMSSPTGGTAAGGATMRGTMTRMPTSMTSDPSMMSSLTMSMSMPTSQTSSASSMSNGSSGNVAQVEHLGWITGLLAAGVLGIFVVLG